MQLMDTQHWCENISKYSETLILGSHILRFPASKVHIFVVPVKAPYAHVLFSLI